jgi:large subunit ribosomal protein L9
MSVDVILVEEYPALGHTGDVVKVKPGYARNFLLPRGIAVEASSTNGKLLKHKMAGAQAKRAKLKVQAEDFAKKLSAIALTFTLKAGEAGKSFGAVSSKDIEAQFKVLGHDIHKKQIKNFDPFRNAGDYRVEVRVHAEVTASVPVKVVVEASKKDESAEKPARGTKGKRGKKVADEASDTTDAPSAE